MLAATDTAPAVSKKPFYKDLSFQVVAAMMLGIVCGLVFSDFAASLTILGDIFLNIKDPGDGHAGIAH